MTWTVSGLIDQRLFNAASTTFAEALTGIGPLQILNKCDDFNAITSDENMLHILIYNKLITSHCSFISKAVEGTATHMAGTVAFHSNNLDLIDCYSIVGP